MKRTNLHNNSNSGLKKLCTGYSNHETISSLKAGKYSLILFLASLFIYQPIKADEGMWIPLLLEKYNYADMQAKGLKLTADEIYSINNTSLKDAIVIFGRGCTGELISDKGLLLTNHHCGYGQIQAHSSLENDYLSDGFWAMNPSEELINKGLTATFLIRMEEVTEIVLDGVHKEMTEKERQEIVKANSEKLVENAIEGTHYTALVKPFFYGNQYYLFVNEVFKDVRLVGAPPSAIGKFGGDTDNWMWPRHTGDFALFRIYADADGKPADYSPENIPYRPKKFLPISLKGIQKDDFTMVYGYPGTTQEYLPSYAVKHITENSNPHKIAIREAILEIMQESMNADPAVRIQYASKSASVANAWKKWIGENRGLKKLNAIERKKTYENDWLNWLVEDRERREEFSRIFLDFRDNYEQLAPYQLALDYFMEAGYAMEIVKSARIIAPLLTLKDDISDEEVEQLLTKIKAGYQGFFKDYHKPTDFKIFRKVFLEMYPNEVPKLYQPDIFLQIEKDFKGDADKYAQHLYSKSILVNPEALFKFLDSYRVNKKKKLQKDPGIQMYQSIMSFFLQEIRPLHNQIQLSNDSLMRHYMALQLAMEPNKVFYPDANFTLRITYGQVADYFPRDAVFYEHFTTLDGIMQKDNPDIYDYRVPEKLKQLWENKDFGPYASNGSVAVCFTGSNHTTGGNSGSPVLNAEGHLVGINFDRNWEGTMSDIMYDPDQCRNITLDVRYLLFIVDKFAGAGHLLEEMEIIR